MYIYDIFDHNRVYLDAFFLYCSQASIIIVCHRSTIILNTKIPCCCNHLNCFSRWGLRFKTLRKSYYLTWKFLLVTLTDFDVILWQKKHPFFKCLRPILSVYICVSLGPLLSVYICLNFAFVRRDAKLEVTNAIFI